MECTKIKSGYMSEQVCEILMERCHQMDMRFPDGVNGMNDWVAYIVAYAGRAVDCRKNNEECQNFRKRMIQVAALALAAVESYDSAMQEAEEKCMPQ